MIRLLLLLSVCLLSFLYSKAQTGTWQADIPVVSEDGFYKIPLQAQLLAKAKNQFRRLRIFEGPREIPYLLKTEAATTSKNAFVTLPITERRDQDSLGYIIFKNPNATGLSSLILTIKRAWVVKKLKISGSNDGQNWFVVRNEFLLNTFPIIEKYNETTVSYRIDLPLTDYEFYRIECNNREDLSINVLSVEKADHLRRKGELLLLPAPRVSEEKANTPTESLFKFTFQEPYILNQLVFKISKPRFFQRQARFYLTDPRTKSSLPKVPDNFEVQPEIFFSLSSNDSLQTIFLENKSVKSFFILIENENNQPLVLESVSAFQKKNFIQAYLEKGKNYTLKIGANDLAKPVYDLAAFENKMGNNIKTLHLGELHALPNEHVESGNRFFETKNWIWFGLIIIGGLLVYMSMQMIKEIK